MLGWLPGASKQDIINRELENGDLNARGTDFADRSSAWNWQDSFGAWMAGTNKEEVLAGARAKRNQQLEDAYGGRAATAKASLGPLAAQYQGVDGKTRQEIESALATDEGRAKAASLMQAEGVDLTTLAPNAGVGVIYGAGTKKKEQDRITERDEGRAYRAELLSADRKYEADLRSEDRRLQMERDARQDLIRAEERRDNLELRRDNMNLEYARLAQADRNKAQDRKDKAIMMLMQGLGNLGTAFTI